MCDKDDEDDEVYKCDCCQTPMAYEDLDDDLLCEGCAHEADEDAKERRSLTAWHNKITGP